MKTELKISVRSYPVQIRDLRTGEVQNDVIVIEKARSQAAQLVGQSDRELIERLYSRQGYHVADIGKPTKQEIVLDLLSEYRKARRLDELRTSAEEREAVAIE